MTTTQVAGGVLVGERGVLLAHRRRDRLNAPDTWSFAGGHVEPGEEPVAALVRELREELGIDAIVAGDPDLRVVQEDGAVFSIWVVREWMGEPVNAAPEEHDELRWVRAVDLDDLDVAYGFCRTLVEQLA